MDPFRTAESTTPTNLQPGAFVSTQGPNDFRSNQAAFNESSVSNIDAFNSQFTVDVPNEIDVDLGGSTTTTDVLNARAQAEAEIAPTPDVLSEVSQTVDTPVITSRFDDYNQIIEDQLFGDTEPTEAEKSRQQILDDYANRVAKIESNINLTESDAREQYRLAERERELAETDLRIAEKTTALRRRLRSFDRDPERAALTRRAFEQERSKIESDARAELADEYIIQAAQSGNLQRAEQLVQTAVENRIRSFELRNQADQARLNALIPTLEGEEKKRAQQLAFALQERERNIADVKAEQEGIHNMMITAATNGASGDLQRQILGAKSLNEAMALAGPFIGRYERLKAELSMESTRLANRERLAKLAMSGDTAAIAALGDYGKSLREQILAAQTEEERQRIEQVTASSYRLKDNSNIAQRLSNSPAFDLVTGVVQNQPLYTVGREALKYSVVPIAGTTVGVGVGIYKQRQNELLRQDFFDDVEALTSRATLDTLINAKAQGATFGALSNAELSLLIQASNALAQKAIVDPDTGTVTGITGTPDEVRRALNEVVDYYKRAELENYRNIFDVSEQTQLNNELGE